MRRLLAIVGATALTIVMVLTVVVGFSLYRAHQIAIEGLPFIEEAVTAVTKNWSAQELFDRASPELRKVATLESVDALFQGQAVQLGAFVEYEGATIADQSYNFNVYRLGSPGSFVGSYSATARYRTGAASFQIAVTKRNGQWMINYFHIDTAPGPRVEEHI